MKTRYHIGRLLGIGDRCVCWKGEHRVDDLLQTVQIVERLFQVIASTPLHRCHSRFNRTEARHNQDFTGGEYGLDLFEQRQPVGIWQLQVHECSVKAGRIRVKQPFHVLARVGNDDIAVFFLRK